MRKLLTDEQIKQALQDFTSTPTSEQLSKSIKQRFNVDINDATLRGRLIAMGMPLSGTINVSNVAPPPPPHRQHRHTK